MQLIGYRTIKTAIGAVMAILIAQSFNLEYAVSAGIITILSIQNTKRKSVKVAFQRFIASIIALLLSVTIFNTFGYHIVTFGIFLFLFIPLTVSLNLQEGIVISSVLVSHLLLEESVSIFWLKNEMALVIIGIAVALMLNLYMPSIEANIKEEQKIIEEKMKEILIKMADALKREELELNDEEIFSFLENKLKNTRKLAYINLNNYFLTDASYYVQYIEMRIQQFETIKGMRQHFQRFFMKFEQSIMIAEFTERVAESIYEENTAEKLINELNNLREDFRKMALPVTREEFENRAMLFQFLNDMEKFLVIKNEFKKNLD